MNAEMLLTDTGCVRKSSLFRGALFREHNCFYLDWILMNLMENTTAYVKLLLFVNRFFHLFILHYPVLCDLFKGSLVRLFVCLFFISWIWTVQSCCLNVECVVARALGTTCDRDYESESGSIEMIRQAELSLLQ